MKSIAIIGGGPAALIAAAFLDTTKYQVTIYEKNKTVGRKFLVAGDGGFNLTHSEDIESFVERYTPDTFLKDALLGFSNEDLINWLESIGIETFVGSSNRVFPTEGIKPIEVLNAILAKLEENKIEIKTEHEWTGWNENGELVFNGSTPIKADTTVFALGGGSWKITGSEGDWLNLFDAKDIKTLPFSPSNCAYKVLWQKGFKERHVGKPLKNISISCFGKEQKGEVVITEFGLEGNAIYALSPQIQEILDKKGEATILIDLKPTLEPEVLVTKMRSARTPKTSDILRKYVKLSPTKMELVKLNVSREDFLSIDLLAKKLKALPITLTGAATLDEAISSTGGISLDQVDSNFEFVGLKDNYCIGEMLDWNAPTGGYLLQACFSMGVQMAKNLNEK